MVGGLIISNEKSPTDLFVHKMNLIQQNICYSICYAEKYAEILDLRFYVLM